MYLEDRMKTFTRRMILGSVFVLLWFGAMYFGLRILLWSLRLVGADI